MRGSTEKGDGPQGGSGGDGTTPKRRRRGHNEGAIYQRESDRRWVACVHLGYEGGKRKRKYVYGETRREVAERLKRLHAEQSRGLPIPPERLTVGDLLDEWMRDVIGPKAAPRTVETYGRWIRLYIKPAIGHLRLAKLARRDVDALMRGMEEKGLSPWTVRQARSVLRSALNHAMRQDLIGRNVAALAEAPRLEQDERPYLTVDQADRLLDAAKGDRLEALWLLLFAMGLRRGEALGLRWDDVDLAAGELRVRRQLQRVKGALLIRDLKTARSRRTLPLPDTVAVALKAHRKRQLQERMLAGDRWQDRGLVFCWGIGTPLEPGGVTAKFRALTAKAKLPEGFRLHDLRHSCAAALVAQKVDARTIMEILGHSNISTTMDIYAHIMPAGKREAADAMDRLLTRREQAG
jgi:integrase